MKDSKEKLIELIEAKYHFAFMSQSLKKIDKDIKKETLCYIYEQTVSDLYNVVIDIYTLFEQLKKRVNSYTTEFNRFIYKVKERSLYINNEILEDHKESICLLKQRIDFYYERFEQLIYGNSVNISFEEQLYDYYDIHRYLLSCFATISSSLDWQSVSYDSSKRVQVFLHNEFDYKGILGYKRVHYPAIINFEKYFIDEYIDNANSELQLVCLMTNSGQGAFVTLKEMICNMLLTHSAKILLSNSSYYETKILVTEQKSHKHVFFETDNEDAIIQQILSEEPDILMIEPYYCNENIVLMDIPFMLKQINSLSLKKNLYIIIDASMMSGAVQPYKTVLTNEKVEVFLIESMIKYRQFGMDKVNAGFIISNKKYLRHLITARASVGSILNCVELNMLPIMNREQYDVRMNTIYRNAKFISSALQDYISNNQYCLVKCIEYPGLEIHADFKKSRIYEYLNGILNIKFDKDYYKNIATMLYWISETLKSAKENNITISHGTSFGFNNTRLSVADSSGGSFSQPFIRISVGRENLKDIYILVNTIKHSIEKFLKY